jgi:hypothetical protein
MGQLYKCEGVDMKKDSRKSGSLAIFLLISFFMALTCSLGVSLPGYAAALNPNPPPASVRLVFIHHSVGANWLSDDNGNLIRGLNANQYFVSDTYYGWGPMDPDMGSPIGDFTDIGHWYLWFLGPNRDTFLSALYPTTHLTPEPDVYGVNHIPQPSGDNTVVLFKSCFVSGYVITGNSNDPPRKSSPGDHNPIWGMGYGNPEYTVSNIKGMYRDLLSYFATRQDKLFILITTPPCNYNDPELIRSSAPLLRAINTWIVYHWLEEYPYNNVAVFDFFNVLTSNGGDPDTNDLGAGTGNHHLLRDGQVRHTVGLDNNFSAYVYDTDSHPTGAGGQKATADFLPLLNVAYHAWQGTGGRPFYMGRSPDYPATPLLLLLD